MPLQATSGAASYDAFGGGVAAVPNYIEDVFSTWLYTGNGSTQTINNGIDLAGKGGLLWMKSRSQVAGHMLYDTASNATLRSDTTGANSGYYPTYISPTSSGFFLDAAAGGGFNTNAVTYASWAFREQPKFFDVVTWTGNGTSSQTINHSLGATPGVIMMKRTDSTGDWWVYHRSLGSSQYVVLNTTDAAQNTGADRWSPTSTTFTATSYFGANSNGATYVAYLFAHDAGGFGLAGTDNVISCGSFTGNGSSDGPTVTLGYEPQWLLTLNTAGGYRWYITDVMRGMSQTSSASLYPNSSEAEGVGIQTYIPTATGFKVGVSSAAFNQNGSTFIYIAIRRGPMKVPTTGTSVFEPVFVSGTAGTVQATNFPVDAQILRYPQSGFNNFFVDRLRGVSTTPANQASPYLITNANDAETTGPNLTYGWSNTGFAISSSFNNLQTIFWNFRRAPGFFDEVCYAGTGATNTAVPHNLTVTPELAIFKNRTTAAYNWVVKTTATFGTNSYLILEGPNSLLTNASYGATASASQVTLSTGGGNAGDWNRSGDNYVAYLFATCPGVSKVGSFTGTGTTQTINCGFTGGARFVLIKRTDNTGDWYVWDSARGIVAGNDPYLLLNSTAAEVTSTDYVDTAATGFELSSTAPAALNASGGSYIFLAIA